MHALIKRIYVRELTNASHRNTASIGAGDIIHKELLAHTHIYKSLIKSIIATTSCGTRVRADVETDRGGLAALFILKDSLFRTVYESYASLNHCDWSFCMARRV